MVNNITDNIMVNTDNITFTLQKDNHTTDPVVIIMAGGLGKRMESDLPKVLHKIGNIPMLYRVIVEARKINPLKILVVVGKYRQIIQNTLEECGDIDDIEFIDQPQPLGTGNAVLCCRNYLINNVSELTNVLILSGDVPLLKANTMIEMLDSNGCKIMTTKLSNPFGYGRIIEINNSFERIVEEKDCTESQKKIQKVNCGIYSIKNRILCKYISYIRNLNAQNEYYLTDLVEIIKNNENINVQMYEIPVEQQLEIMGVNTKSQLEELEKLL